MQEQECDNDKYCVVDQIIAHNFKLGFDCLSDQSINSAFGINVSL